MDETDGPPEGREGRPRRSANPALREERLRRARSGWGEAASIAARTRTGPATPSARTLPRLDGPTDPDLAPRPRKRTVSVNDGDEARINRLLAKVGQRWGKISYSSACRSLFRLLEAVESELDGLPLPEAEALRREPKKNDLTGIIEHERAFVDLIASLVHSRLQRAAARRRATPDRPEEDGSENEG